MAHLLLVDDEPTLLQQMAALLQRAGHTVSTARDGSDAVKLLGFEGGEAESMPDIVVMDIMMPRVNGYMVCAKMKEDPRTKEIPTIMLTGYSDLKEIFDKFPNVSAFLNKPFDNSHFLNAIADVLAEIRLKRQSVEASQN